MMILKEAARGFMRCEGEKNARDLRKGDIIDLEGTEHQIYSDTLSSSRNTVAQQKWLDLRVVRSYLMKLGRIEVLDNDVLIFTENKHVIITLESEPEVNIEPPYVLWSGPLIAHLTAGVKVRVYKNARAEEFQKEDSRENRIRQNSERHILDGAMV